MALPLYVLEPTDPVPFTTQTFNIKSNHNLLYIQHPKLSSNLYFVAIKKQDEYICKYPVLLDHAHKVILRKTNINTPLIKILYQLGKVYYQPSDTELAFLMVFMPTYADQFFIERGLEYLYLGTNKYNHEKYLKLYTQSFSAVYQYVMSLTNKIKNINTISLYTQKGLPPNVQAAIQQEQIKLNNLPPSSNERGSILNYIETLKAVPWNQYKLTSIDLELAKNILNTSHYGLDEVKETILHELFLQKFSQQQNGLCLCFDGPPGTGKTTIAKSIAKALGRPFKTISMSGITDPSFLIGHHRTFSGARPGSIAQALIDTQTLSPVILLDELDKIDKYNSASALAVMYQLLDPEQNHSFKDLYLDQPIDVSKVIFISTTNEASHLPTPLLDRLQIIKFRDYSKAERLHILKHYMIDSILQEYNLSDKLQVNISDNNLDILANETMLRTAKQLLAKAIKQQIYNSVGSPTEINLSFNQLQSKLKPTIGFIRN